MGIQCHLSIGKTRPWAQASPDHGHGPGQGQHLTMGTGRTQPRALAAPNHRHGQHLTTGTSSTQPWVRASWLTTGMGTEEAATSMGATPQWAMGTQKHPFPRQSQLSPFHGTEPKGQWAMGKRQTRSKSISGQLDGLLDHQVTDRHAGATGSLHHHGALKPPGSGQPHTKQRVQPAAGQMVEVPCVLLFSTLYSFTVFPRHHLQWIRMCN